jgi:hypothetical protein
MAFIAYFIYFSGEIKPVVLNNLSHQFSFQSLLSVGVTILGKPTIVALASGFIALAAYFTSLSTSGGFAGLQPRAAGLFLVNQMVGWFVVGLLIVGLRVFPYSLYTILFLYVPIVVVSMLAIPAFASDLSYDELAESQGNSLGGIVNTYFVRRLRFTHLLLIIVGGEVLYFLNNNPKFPLLGWFLIGWALMGATLAVASGEGIAFQLVSWKYVSVTSIAGETFSGYLISKGADHYIFVTKDKGTFLLPSSSIREIRIAPRPIGEGHPKPMTHDNNQT